MKNTKLKKRNKNLLEGEPPYKTYALADDAKRDPKTNAAIPSQSAVEGTRDWSIENKL